VAFVLAGVTLLLTLFEFGHGRRVSSSVEVFAPQVGGLHPAR
jgi:hypothetical protein